MKQWLAAERVLRVLFMFLGALTTCVLIGCDEFIFRKPFRPTRPNVGQLQTLYADKKNVFEEIRAMTFVDRPAMLFVGPTDPTDPTDLESSGLSLDRIHEYRALLSSIRPGLIMYVATGNFFGDDTIKIIFEDNRPELTVGATWANGIEYFSTYPERYGTIIKDSTEINLKSDDTYLIQIDKHWFVFHEQDS